MSLGNIHAIASSHDSLLKAVSTQAASNWHALIESTGWLTHVADLLKAAGGRDGIVGRMLQDNDSVLVVRYFEGVRGTVAVKSLMLTLYSFLLSEI